MNTCIHPAVPAFTHDIANIDDLRISAVCPLIMPTLLQGLATTVRAQRAAGLIKA